MSPKLYFKLGLGFFLCLGLLAFSSEIIVRRWVYHQVPSAAPTWSVLLILLLNSWVLFQYGRLVARSVRSTKTERN